MSDASSSHSHAAASPKPSWRNVVVGLALAGVAYKLPQWLVADVAPFLVPVLPFSQNIQVFTLYLIVELLTIGFIALSVRILGYTFAGVGLTGFRLRFLLNAAAGYLAYFGLVLGALIIAQMLGIPLDEDQPLGFSDPIGAELAFIFIMLALFVPLAEELLFRGLLYKVLRGRLPFVATALLVSLAFAIVHGQLVVGIDVFMLSLVVCYLREKTGSIWPGVMVHSLKNSVAFFLLFIYNGA